jgi:hypothetical protein
MFIRYKCIQKRDFINRVERSLEDNDYNLKYNKLLEN